MTVQGMNLSAVREIAGRFHRTGEDLQTTITRIDRLVHNVPWRGADADRFCREWSTSTRADLKYLVTVLEQISDQLRTQAEQQQGASDHQGQAGGTPSGGAPSGGSPTGPTQQGFFGQIGQFWGAGLEWAQEQAGEVWGQVQEGAQQLQQSLWNSAENGLIGLNRVGVASEAFASHTVLELSQGRLPQNAEVAAFAVLMTGLGAGTVTNAVSGTDTGLFAPGRPQVGEPIRTVGGSAGRVGAPTDFQGLARTTTDAYEGVDGVRVTVTRNPGEPPRYIVSIPGTQAPISSISEGWSSNPNGRNWSDNLWAVGTGTTGFTEGAKEAVAQAIAADQAEHPGESYGGKPQLLLTGHSQGGIIAANMASDPAFAAQYDIRGIVTEASPIDCAEIPGNVPVLSLQSGHLGDVNPLGLSNPLGTVVPDLNGLDPSKGPGPFNASGDLVPQLDFHGENVLGVRESHPNVTEVDLGVQADVEHILNPFANHEQANYNDLTSNEVLPGTPAGDQVDQWAAQNDLSDFYSVDPGSTVTYDVPVGVTKR